MRKKNRVTFLIITSKHGKQLRFSLSRYIISLFVIILVLLFGSGIVGTWKYHENMVLREKALMLEAEKNQLEAISRTVKHVKEKNSLIHELLGLDDTKIQQSQDIKKTDPVNLTD